MTVEFQPFEKIARLNRNIVVTEKIDGTNAAVLILPTHTIDHVIVDDKVMLFDGDKALEVARVLVDINEAGDWETYSVFAQSRSRFITPGNDNFGFAAWVQKNAQGLVEILGEGRHFGEWWGAGIQRGYGRQGKTFSMFNTGRWHRQYVLEAGLEFGLELSSQLDVVPVLYEGPFNQMAIEDVLHLLRLNGSAASPDFLKPEGVVVYHEAARQSFKITLEHDEAPKSTVGLAA